MSDAVEGGRSVLLTHPVNVVLPGLAEHLERCSHRMWIRIDLRELADRPGTLVQRVLDHLGHPHLAEEDGVTAMLDPLAGRALWLVPDEGVQGARELVRFIEEVSVAATRLEPHRRPLLACACPAEGLKAAPGGEAALLRTYWWNRITPLDTLIAVQERLERSLVLGDREVIAELAGWDLALADDLALSWDGYPVSGAGLPGATPPVEETMELIHHARATVAVSAPPAPPAALYAAWASGTVDWWGDRALVHLSTHLAVGDLDTVSHRIWRGQIKAVLPFVEIMRERLAVWAQERSHLAAPYWRHKDLTALEVGVLEKVIADSAHLRRSARHYEMARLLRRARHKLAHLQAVDRETIARVESLVGMGTLSGADAVVVSPAVHERGELPPPARSGHAQPRNGAPGPVMPAALSTDRLPR